MPGYAPQVTSAYVVGRRNPSGNFSIVIYLHLTETNEAVIYVHDLVEVGVAEFPDVEAEALTFGESMGFMVDNANYRNLTPLQQEEILESLPCFRADLSAFEVVASYEALCNRPRQTVDAVAEKLGLRTGAMTGRLVSEMRPESVKPLTVSANPITSLKASM